MSGTDPAIGSGHQAGAPPSKANNRAPLLATLLGCGVVLVSLGTPVEPVSGTFAERLAFVGGATASSLLLAWGLAYLIAIRRASFRWKLGSALGLAAFAVLLAVVRAASPSPPSDRDMASTAAQLERLQQDPSARFAADADSGPFARVMASLMGGMQDDRREFALDMENAGFAQVATLKGLNPASPALSHCERFDALAAKARSYPARLPTHVSRARAVGQAAGLPASQLAALESDRLKADYAEGWRLHSEFARGVGERCRFLASHNWKAQGGQALFESERDAAQFNEISDRVNAIVVEQQRRTGEAGADLEQLSAS